MEGLRETIEQIALDVCDIKKELAVIRSEVARLKSSKLYKNQKGQHIATDNAPLEKLSTVRVMGVATNEARRGESGVTVNVYDGDTNALVGSTTSQANGSWIINVPHPGTYVVEYKKQGKTTKNINIKIAKGVPVYKLSKDR